MQAPRCSISARDGGEADFTDILQNSAPLQCEKPNTHFNTICPLRVRDLTMNSSALWSVLFLKHLPMARPPALLVPLAPDKIEHVVSSLERVRTPTSTSSQNAFIKLPKTTLTQIHRGVYSFPKWRSNIKCILQPVLARGRQYCCSARQQGSSDHPSLHCGALLRSSMASYF